jgi:SnoaL-like domain
VPISAEDKVAILELVARYNHAIDGHDPEAWADTFAGDGGFEATGRGPFNGREQLVQFAADFNQEMPNARHWSNSAIIEGDGDSATLDCYLLLMNGRDIATFGTYHDTVAKVDGEWKFTYRNATIGG